MTHEENTYYAEFDAEEALAGRIGWRVKDRNATDRENEVVAYCTGEREANTVVDALNFNAHPHKYGFELSKRETGD